MNLSLAWRTIRYRSGEEADHRYIESDDRILKDREMTVRLNELGASSINFVVRVWSKSSDLQNVYWDVLERMKRDFDANGISFPYPQMDVNVKRSKSLLSNPPGPASPAGPFISIANS
jgi:small-conductance mechanosensitive channel